MGLTLVAILTAALLLPGIVAARAFYRAAHIKEVEVPIPQLSSPDGIALVGMFSVGVHLLYVFLLFALAQAPELTKLPLPNPYALLLSGGEGRTSLYEAFTLFSGLAGLSLLAHATGIGVGRAVLQNRESATFYGPISEIISAGWGEDNFITAYVLTKIGSDERLVGYQGVVVSLIRDADSFPAKVILRDVSIFYLRFSEGAPDREETNETIDWIALSSAEWHNIAFKVFKLEQPATAPPEKEAA